MKELTLKMTPQGLVKVKEKKPRPIAKTYLAHCCMNCRFGEEIGGDEMSCPKCIGGYTHIFYVCRLFRFK